MSLQQTVDTLARRYKVQRLLPPIGKHHFNPDRHSIQLRALDRTSVLRQPRIASHVASPTLRTSPWWRPDKTFTHFHFTSCKCRRWNNAIVCKRFDAAARELIGFVGCNSATNAATYVARATHVVASWLPLGVLCLKRSTQFKSCSSIFVDSFICSSSVVQKVNAQLRISRATASDTASLDGITGYRCSEFRRLCSCDPVAVATVGSC